MRFRDGGKFDREQMPTGLRRFAPVESLSSLKEVDLDELHRKGKKLILIDVDNTLLPWRSKEVPQETLDWVAKAKVLGMNLCAISNTHNPSRLEQICKDLDITFVRDKNKPSRNMYRKALALHKATEQEAVMIGDQLLTDIFGANRCGIDALWVHPMTRTEFVGTKVFNRTVEHFLGKFMYRYFQPTTIYGVQPQGTGLFKHQIVNEFVKFAIIGATSTCIDFGLNYLLLFKASIGGVPLYEIVGKQVLAILSPDSPLTADALQNAAFAPLKVLPVLIAIFNGYYWNSKWTFKVAAKGLQKKLIIKFYIVALCAMLVNIAVSTLVTNLLHDPSTKSWGIASVSGMLVAAIANFAGQRAWTFKGERKRNQSTGN